MNNLVVKCAIDPDTGTYKDAIVRRDPFDRFPDGAWEVKDWYLEKILGNDVIDALRPFFLGVTHRPIAGFNGGRVYINTGEVRAILELNDVPSDSK